MILSEHGLLLWVIMWCGLTRQGQGLVLRRALKVILSSEFPRSPTACLPLRALLCVFLLLGELTDLRSLARDGDGVGFAFVPGLATTLLWQGQQGTPSLYDWLLIDPGADEHLLLVRRSISKPDELAYYICHTSTPVPIVELVRVAGSRWAVEETFQFAKNETGLDHYQVRHYDAWYRHITLSMLAAAFLAVTAYRERLPDQHRDDQKGAPSTTSTTPNTGQTGDVCTKPAPAEATTSDNTSNITTCNCHTSLIWLACIQVVTSPQVAKLG